MVCGQCGQGNAPGARFCAACGAQFAPPASVASTPPVITAPPAPLGVASASPIPFAPPGGVFPSGYGAGPVSGPMTAPTAGYPAAVVMPTATSCLVCGVVYGPPWQRCPRCQTPAGMVVNPEDSTASTYVAIFPAPPAFPAFHSPPQDARKHRIRLAVLIASVVTALTVMIGLSLMYGGQP